MASVWTKLSDRLPPDDCGALLVTNNLSARDANGKMSHLWLVSTIFARKGGFHAFDQCDGLVHGLTHWRYAIPEENGCAHLFESNPGLWDTQHRYCAKCGVAE